MILRYSNFYTLLHLVKNQQKYFEAKGTSTIGKNMLCFFAPSHLKIKVKTWSKDSYGLFDYQATDTSSETYKVNESTKIQWVNKSKINDIPAASIRIQSHASNQPSIKEGQDKVKVSLFGYIECSSPTKKSKNKIFSFHPRKEQRTALNQLSSNCSLTNDKLNSKFKSPYIVIKNYTDQSKINNFKLILGSVIKLGIVQLKVIQIYSKNRQQVKNLPQTQRNKNKKASFQQTCISLQQGKPALRTKNQKENIASLQTSSTSSEDSINVKISNQGTCKFCLQSQQQQSNPLISPCKCSGSCSAVHIECLKSWINAKVKRETSGVVTSLNFQKFQCEICKQPYPTLMSYKAQSINLVKIDKPSKPYIILEGISLKNHSAGQQSKRKSIHILSPENNQIKIGRAESCELCIDDKTISRVHSSISLKNGNFYISDCNSKFGTLVQLQKSLKLQSKIALQMGRSVVELSPK